MKIALDIDNVILDYDDEMLNAMLEEDKNKRNRGIINKNADYIFCGLLDWSNEEIEEFLNDNTEKIAENFKCLKNAKKYIDKLLEENNEVFLITNRTYPHYKNAYKTTISSLKKHGINFTKLIFTETNDKSEACLLNSIDVLVDDRARNCYYVKNKGIDAILLKSRYEKRNFDDLLVAENWEDLYLKLKNKGE